MVDGTETSWGISKENKFSKFSLAVQLIQYGCTVCTQYNQKCVHLNFLEDVQLYTVYTAQLDCINNLSPLGWTSVPTDPEEDS